MGEPTKVKDEAGTDAVWLLQLRVLGFGLFQDGNVGVGVFLELKQTQSFLGHSGIGITSDVYVHLQPDSEVESMAKLEEAFFGELCSTVLKTGDEGSKSSIQ